MTKDRVAIINGVTAETARRDARSIRRKLDGAQAHLLRARGRYEARRVIRGADLAACRLGAARFAVFALAPRALAVIVVRSGLLEILPALATFAGALVHRRRRDSCSPSAVSW